MKKSLYLFAALLVSAVACTEESKEDTLTLSSTSYLVPSSGASQTLAFSANNSWTISSDQDWVTFNSASGDAGDASVTITVSANDTYDSRSATLTLSAASKTSKISVTQSGKNEFGSEFTFDLDSKEQDITVATTSNVEYSVQVEENAKDWLSIVKTKSAPVSGTVVLHVKANTTLGTREGRFTITADTYSQTYVVRQNSEYVVLSKAEGIYLGHVQDIYDTENWAYNTFRQFAVILTGEGGEKVTLALNAGADASKDVLPEGEYSVDVSASHAANTFSVKSTDGKEKYYTTVISNGSEISVVDGTVNVLYADGNYTITALLVDASDNQHQFAYTGAISFKDESFGAQALDLTFHGQYNTYFSTKANEWQFSLCLSEKDKDSNPVFYRYITVALYAPSDATLENGLPVGTFKYELPETDESLGYPNGITMAHANTFSLGGSSDAEGFSSVSPAEGTSPELVISKNDDGTYTFKVSGSFVDVVTVYDDEGNETSTSTPFDYSATIGNVVMPEPTEGEMPTPDGSDVLDYVFASQYIAYWYGDNFSTGNDVYMTGFTNINNVYTVNLLISSPGGYEFVVNFAKRYCKTPFPVGKYDFYVPTDELKAKDFALIKSANSYVENSYTGHKFTITGGYVTFTATTVEFNLQTTATDGSVYTFTGGFDASFYYMINRAKK